MAQEYGDPLPVGALHANRIVLAPDNSDEILPKANDATVPHDAAGTCGRYAEPVSIPPSVVARKSAQSTVRQAKSTGWRPSLDLCIHRRYTVGVSELRFEWDPRKAAANKSKHGVTFDEAVSVFADELALFMADPEHSDKETGSSSWG